MRDDIRQEIAARRVVAREHAKKAATLDGIAALLSGTEWSADTLDEIAERLRSVGYTIADVDNDVADVDND